jgi:hypothetical protein
MTEQPEKNIYWTEGVTRKEVERALTSTKHPSLYRRPTRRALIMVYMALVVLLLISESIGTPKVSSYVAAITAILLIPAYLLLRYSVRLIADAPAELLDERLVMIRDRTYLSAYRWLSFVVGIIMGTAIATDFSFGVDSWWAVFVAIAMVIAGLPSMILAWRLPSEEPASEDAIEGGR